MLLLPLLGYLLLARRSHVSPLSVTRAAITNFGTLGSAEPSFFQQPNFMCCVHATRNASLYFSYLMCEFSSHYARYVLVYASC